METQLQTQEEPADGKLWVNVRGFFSCTEFFTSHLLIQNKNALYCGIINDTLHCGIIIECRSKRVTMITQGWEHDKHTCIDWDSYVTCEVRLIQDRL